MHQVPLADGLGSSPQYKLRLSQRACHRAPLAGALLEVLEHASGLQKEGTEGAGDDEFDYTVVLSPNLEFKGDFNVDGRQQSEQMVWKEQLTGFPMAVVQFPLSGATGRSIA